MSSDSQRRPNRCVTCAHYFVTYDPHFPYGCRAMNFKSRYLPQHEVMGASQQACLSYAKKTAGPQP